ncbi:hypothetical protein [Arthrobacter sp. AFG20]|uniref:hypothetical protein n=1 Tax=Arthrobacter sp. AFG20 TaxID=1688671 RepID=UPI0011AFCD88|nr:hypothetical protein [Arthrobacter sp. AFG20]
MNTASRLFGTTVLAAGLTLGSAALAAGAASADTGPMTTYSSPQHSSYDKDGFDKAGHNRPGKECNGHWRHVGKDKGKHHDKGKCRVSPPKYYPKDPVHPIYPQR